MKLNFFISTTIVLALSAFINNASAESFQYKWKDSNGEVHYTERPPAKGIEFETIRVKTHVSSQPVQTAIKKEKTQLSSDEQAQNEKYNNWRKENCKRALQNLDILENTGRISQDDGQGGTRLMNDEEKQEKTRIMTEQKEKYCSEATEDSE